MSFNQPPPGPYGSSGQPPQGPYGSSGQPQPQGGGFGPPQGPPPGPPPQQPGPYGYGAAPQPPQFPPPGPPGGPNGSNTGKIIAGVAAGVVLIGAIIGGAVMLTTSGDNGGRARADGNNSPAPTAGSDANNSSEESPAAEGTGRRMRLTTPRTVDDGAYTLEKDKAALQRDGLKLGSPPPGMTQEIARYRGTRDSRTTGLMISGGYGTISDPDSVVDGMFSGVADGGTTVVKRRETFRPGGAGGSVKIDCEVVRNATFGYAPVCGWADGSTAAVLLYMNGSLRSSSDVNLSQYADTTAVVRGEVRKPE
ncbi:hypothetical protein CP973_07945 [Streptomyces albofaciens JCM 4342]|uniref:hypothetical protein n=1 Tax=Streptomyces albofaciens TaxID=66866 RepID=UPI00123AC867|nr:hypothetical protein [Streptomyces albofaciens]KAA6221898.1 hypothetical protein CP973_07945 [Streptomyces albofaciens JCM 4342]